MVAALFAAIMLGSTFALAAPGGASAEELKARGNDAMQKLDFPAALAAYQAALEKSPGDVTLLYNVGRAQEALGNKVAALDALLEFERKAPPEIKAKVPLLAALLAELRARVGELSVRCTVDLPKATVLVGDLAKLEGCGVTPAKVRVTLPAPRVEVDVHLVSDAYRAAIVRVPLEGNAPPVDVELAASAKVTTGVLYVKASPASAIVSVDGAPKGTPPVEIVLPAGAHVVDVSAERHESAHVPLVIDAGGRKDLDLTLEKKPSITSSWWFWTAAGVVVAGVATGVTVLLVQPEKEPGKGTIPPGVISAPLVTF